MTTYNSLKELAASKNINFPEFLGTTVADHIAETYELDLDDVEIGFIKNDINEYFTYEDTFRDWRENNLSLKAMCDDYVNFMIEINKDVIIDSNTKHKFLLESMSTWYKNLTTRQKLILFLKGQNSSTIQNCMFKIERILNEIDKVK